MGTLTLDKSKNALAVLAWRKGMTRKRFRSLAEIHDDAEARNKPHATVRGLGGLTVRQALSLKKR